MEELNLGNLIDKEIEEEATEDKEASKEKETKEVEKEKEEPKEEPKPEDTKDPFEGKEEGKDFFVLNDGKRVSKQDMVDGYMRQEDYTKKTTEISEVKRQLELAGKQDGGKEKLEETKSRLEEESDEVTKALEEMDKDDPMAKILKGITQQNKQIITFINKTIDTNEKSVATTSAEKQAEFATKMIRESLDSEAKNYNLPEFKDPKSGEATKTKDLWEQLVLTELQRADSNMTLPEFKQLINGVGKRAFKQLRSLISAANATKVDKDKEKDSESLEAPSEDGDKKPKKPKEEKEEKRKPLASRLENAIDRLPN